ncbi:MAG: lysylphosphatidylglycerol synthase transmembrane domain-containing protein [Longimicrobiales bacterium]
MTGARRAADTVDDGVAVQANRQRAWRRFTLRVFASIALLSIVLWILPWDEVRGAFGRVPAAAFLAAIGIYMSLHLLGAAKWRLVVNAAGADISMLDAVRFYWAGLFGNLFLPSVVGGDVVRAGLALRHARSKTGLVLGSVVDRIVDVLGLAAVAGLGVLMLPTALDARSRGVFLGLFALLSAGGLVVAGLGYLFLKRRLSFRVRRGVVGLRRAVRTMKGRPSVVIATFLMGVTLQVSLVILTAWLGRLCGIDAPIQVWLFVWPLAKISALVPLTQGGLGVREAAQAALFAPFGVAASLAVAVSLVFQGVIIAGGLIGGGLSFLLGRRAQRREANDGAAVAVRDELAFRQR